MRDNPVARIAGVMQCLPQGTTLKTLYLPLSGRALRDGDALARYVRDEARVYAAPQLRSLTAVPAAADAAGDTIEVMGQRLPREEAQTVIATLGLRPVYLLTNGSQRTVNAQAYRADAAQADPGGPPWTAGSGTDPLSGARRVTVVSGDGEVGSYTVFSTNGLRAPDGWRPHQEQAQPDEARRPLGAVVEEMQRASGAIILADLWATGMPVLPPDKPTTADNVGAQIDAIVRSLPDSATWARVYLPVPTGKTLDPEAVADYVLDQAALFGGIGGGVPAGYVQILGRRVPRDQAAVIITLLHLKPVILITNPLWRMAGMSADAAEEYASSMDRYAAH